MKTLGAILLGGALLVAPASHATAPNALQLVQKHVRALQAEDFKAVSETLADRVVFVTAPWERPEGKLVDRSAVMVTFMNLPIAIGKMRSFDCAAVGDSDVKCTVVYVLPDGRPLSQVRDFVVSEGAISKIVINRFERVTNG